MVHVLGWVGPKQDASHWLWRAAAPQQLLSSHQSKLSHRVSSSLWLKFLRGRGGASRGCGLTFGGGALLGARVRVRRPSNQKVRSCMWLGSDFSAPPQPKSPPLEASSSVAYGKLPGEGEGEGG